MTSPGSPAEARALIIERLVGESGDATHVIAAGRAMAERALGPLQKRFADDIGIPVTLELSSVDVGRTSEARSDAGEVFALAVVASPMSSDAVTMVMDAPAIAIIVSTLFGADPDQPVSPIERDLSQLETDVSTLVFNEIAQVLNGSGRRSLDLRLPVARAIAGAEARQRVLRDGAAVRIVFGISTAVDAGKVSILIPQRVLLAMRDGAATGAQEADTGSQWRSRFSEEVMRSAVRLEATMPLARLTLGQIAALVPGQVIDLEENAQARVRLSARAKTLFVCEFGKLGQNYTVRINHPFDADQDMIEGLMPG